MTMLDDDVAATRRALAALERSVEALVRHYGDTVDVRRLATDVGRLAPDLDLLCGSPKATAPPVPPPAPVREVIPDTSYAHDFWMDAEDEGLGQGRHR